MIAPRDPGYVNQLRLFIEELCCELVRFHHVKEDGRTPEEIRIKREVQLGPGAFADVLVQSPGRRPYFVEVKYGYSRETLLRHLKRKYGEYRQEFEAYEKVIVVLEAQRLGSRQELETALRDAIAPKLNIEIWDEAHLTSLVREGFGSNFDEPTPDTIHRLRTVIDDAKWRYAFGPKFVNDPLKQALLWHFGFWRLRQLRERRKFTPENVLPEGPYSRVVVLLADLCSFSSFVRDTRDETVIQHCLMTFYSGARYLVLNSGGMLYHFAGDEVIGLFGIPDREEGYVENAMECARALRDLGSSVSNEWQRHIDRQQTSGGVHIGMAFGSLDVIGLRPFTRSHFGGISDSINVAARLCGAAGSGEILISNFCYEGLNDDAQAQFKASDSLECRNVGVIKCWKMKA